MEPDLRVGDEERERTVTLLHEHASRGRLDPDELDARVEAALRRTRIVLRRRASEAARLVLRLERRRGDHFRRRRTFHVRIDAGANVLRLRARLRPARYRLVGTAVDAAV